MVRFKRFTLICTEIPLEIPSYLHCWKHPFTLSSSHAKLLFQLPFAMHIVICGLMFWSLPHFLLIRIVLQCEFLIGSLAKKLYSRLNILEACILDGKWAYLSGLCILYLAVAVAALVQRLLPLFLQLYYIIHIYINAVEYFVIIWKIGVACLRLYSQLIIQEEAIA